MRESALFGGLHVPIRREKLFGGRDVVSAEVVERDAVGRQDGQLLLFDQIIFSCVCQNGGDVGGDKALIFPNADNQGTVLADGKELVGNVLKQNAEGVRALKTADSTDDGVCRISVVIIIDQMCHNLGIGIRNKRVAHRLKRTLQRQIVLNDTVMHKRNTAVRMGMRIDIGWLPVGGPAGVTDADVAGRRTGRDKTVFEIGKPSLSFFYRNVSVFEHSNTGRVIAPILQLLQPVKENIGCLTRAVVTYNSAHSDKTSSICICGADRLCFAVTGGF